MKTKTKRIWQALALAGAFAVAAGLLWNRHSPPQIITLPSGEQFEFVAAEWGTNLVQPTAAARFLARLPAPVNGYVYRKWGSRLGIVKPISSSAFFWGSGPIPAPEPVLRLWFRALSTNTSSTSTAFKFMLADQNGVVAGRVNGGLRSYGQGKDRWLTLGFPALPRRSETLQLLVFKSEGQFNGIHTQIGTVRFRNPLYGNYPDWRPETLPVTKTADNLTVRLTDFRVGSVNRDGDRLVVDGRRTRFHPPERGEDQEVVFKLDIQSPGGTNESWSVRPAELSDASGNRVRAEICNRWPVTDEYSFGPTLWPDESAWRMKLTLRRNRGHDPEEIMTFINIPKTATGGRITAFQTNLIHGVPVILKQEFKQDPDLHPDLPSPTFGSQPAMFVRAELVNPPEGFVVDYKEMKADTGWTSSGKVLSDMQWTRNSASVSLRSSSIPADVRSLDITWTVQKTRTVEFLVMPPKME